MQTTFPCPACTSDAWADVGTHRYWRVEHQPGGIWHRDEEIRLRRRVLFEVWFPTADEVTLKSRRCCVCGTVCYEPRPDDAELSRKYNFLRAEMPGSLHSEISPPVQAADSARALNILETITPYLLPGSSVLDVGGGDGRLMAPFADRGFQCFLVDQVDYVRPLVTKLADRMDGVATSLTFDAAIVSHVLEHVASPRQLLALIYGRLRNGGVAYVEVPHEVFYNNACNPIIAQPVEHVSFFSLEGVERLLRSAGFTVGAAAFDWSSYEGKPLPVVRAVGVKSGARESAAQSKGNSTN